MAEQKTVPTSVRAEDYIAAVPENRRADATGLLELMRTATGEEAVMWGPSIVGFGSYHYRGKSAKGEWMRVGFAVRSREYTLYGLLDSAEDELLARLGPHTTGKGCVYIKRLSDVDRDALAELVSRSYRAPRIAEEG